MQRACCVFWCPEKKTLNFGTFLRFRFLTGPGFCVKNLLVMAEALKKKRLLPRLCRRMLRRASDAFVLFAMSATGRSLSTQKSAQEEGEV